MKKFLMVIIGVLIFSYPAMLSYDVFNYITTAKVAFFYHENPYVVMPIEFTGDPNLAFTRAANKIALYGPTWIGLTGVPHVLGFNNIVATIISFKILAAGFYIATTWLIWKLSRNLFSVVLFAFNPLVIIETLVSTHNDVVMMFFALTSFYLLRKRRVVVACVFLVLSVLIKYATFVLVPLFLFGMYQLHKGKKINWEDLFSMSGWAMLIMVFLAPLREEIYPWYIIWPLSFAVLVPKKTFLLSVILALSFTTLLRYVPVLYTGSYGGITPMVKELATFAPLTVVVTFLVCKRFFWQNLPR